MFAVASHFRSPITIPTKSKLSAIGEAPVHRVQAQQGTGTMFRTASRMYLVCRQERKRLQQWPCDTLSPSKHANDGPKSWLWDACHVRAIRSLGIVCLLC